MKHNTNSRKGKQKATAVDPGHGRHAGHAKALRKLGRRSSRRKTNRWYKEGVEKWVN